MMQQPKSLFPRFTTSFRADPDAIGPAPSWCATDTLSFVGSEPHLYTDFIKTTAHSSFDKALLRVLLPTTHPSIETWNSPTGWKSAWPNLTKFFTVFAFDWQGNQLGFDKRRIVNGEPLIGLLEPGTGKLLKIPATFAEFVERELIDNRDAVLASTSYSKWMASGQTPGFDQCIGYRVPLFLGGRDDVTNLSLGDMDVYLSMMGQMFVQMRE